MTSLNLRYHAMTGQKDGRMYVHDATTAAPVSDDFGNLTPDDAAALAFALNRENGCYVQHGEYTYRLRIDRPATVRLASNIKIVCTLPVVLPDGGKGRIEVSARDGVHVARFVGMAVEVYDPSDPSDGPIIILDAL